MRMYKIRVVCVELYRVESIALVAIVEEGWSEPKTTHQIIQRRKRRFGNLFQSLQVVIREAIDDGDTDFGIQVVLGKLIKL